VARNEANASIITQFSSRRAAHAMANLTGTTSITITCSNRKAELIRGMSLLRDSLKGTINNAIDNENGLLNLMIKGRYDTDEGILVDGNDAIIQILDDNIPGSTPEEIAEIIEINPVDENTQNFPIKAGNNANETAANNLKKYKDKLVEVFKIL